MRADGKPSAPAMSIDILVQVISYLPEFSRLDASSTCKHWNEAAWMAVSRLSLSVPQLRSLGKRVAGLHQLSLESSGDVNTNPSFRGPLPALPAPETLIHLHTVKMYDLERGRGVDIDVKFIASLPRLKTLHIDFDSFANLPPCMSLEELCIGATEPRDTHKMSNGLISISRDFCSQLSAQLRNYPSLRQLLHIQPYAPIGISGPLFAPYAVSSLPKLEAFSTWLVTGDSNDRSLAPIVEIANDSNSLKTIFIGDLMHHECIALADSICSAQPKGQRLLLSALVGELHHSCAPEPYLLRLVETSNRTSLERLMGLPTFQPELVLHPELIQESWRTPELATRIINYLVQLRPGHTLPCTIMYGACKNSTEENIARWLERGIPVTSAAQDDESTVRDILYRDDLRVDAKIRLVKLLINRGESIERAIGEHAVATYAAGLLLQSKELYDAFVAHRLVDPRSATAYGGNIFHACPVQFTGDISFDKAAVEAATAAGAFVNAKDSCGDTPLHVACRLVPSHTWLHMLLANDANPNAQDKNGYTPLGLPAYSSTAQSVSLLLKFGAKWNVPLCNTEPRTILENCLMKEEVWLFKAAVLAGPVILRRLCDDAEASANKLRITVPSIIAKLRDNPANARVQ